MHNRLFKFRGKVNGEWHYAVPFAQNPFSQQVILSPYLFTDDDTKHHNEQYAVDQETFGQFSNCYDKNKKEIYEDDIVRFISYFSDGKVWCYARVVYVNGSFRLNDAMNSLLADLCNGELAELEVVGNVFDNPELLKKVAG